MLFPRLIPTGCLGQRPEALSRARPRATCSAPGLLKPKRLTRPRAAGKRNTRGRGLPLTGFAVQPVARLRDQFDIIYQGSFFDSGITKPCHNGEPCLPARVDDVLEAINLRVVERDGP